MFFSPCFFPIILSIQIRIAALNAASAAADESQDPLRSRKGQTKEAQVQNYKPYNQVIIIGFP